MEILRTEKLTKRYGKKEKEFITLKVVRIVEKETPLFLQIIIEDKGDGIKEKELPKIFNRFYKGQSSPNPMSIGIGLYITKTIIEAQKGSIIVCSKEGVGTKFIITFLKTVI